MRAPSARRDAQRVRGEEIGDLLGAGDTAQGRGPAVAAGGQPVAGHRGRVVAAAPSLAGAGGRPDEGHGPVAAAVPPRPALQPGRNGGREVVRRSARRHSGVRRDRIGDHVHVEDGRRMYRSAAPRDLEELGLDSGEGRDPAGQHAGQISDQPSAVRESGGRDPVWIDAVPGLNHGQQVADEQAIIDAARLRVTRAARGPSDPAGRTWQGQSLRISDQESALVGQGREPGLGLQARAGAVGPVKGEHQRDRPAGTVTGWHVQPVAARAVSRCTRRRHRDQQPRRRTRPHSRPGLASGRGYGRVDDPRGRAQQRSRGRLPGTRSGRVVPGRTRSAASR